MHFLDTGSQQNGSAKNAFTVYLLISFMFQLIPRPVRTKCQERAAMHHNPGTNPYGVCLAQCEYEELEAIDGDEVDLTKLYPLTEKFPFDYRYAVRRAIDECNALLQSRKHRMAGDGKQCSMVGVEVDNCLHRITFNNCPNSRWKASITCNKVRQGLKIC
uniref:Uncharacterized protein n=1 Tax=Anopheles christyi TaxID=43041 RepID=A0A9I3A6K8_9DIPT